MVGTWSYEPFGNDAAADWAFELDDADSWQIVADLLTTYLSATGANEEADQLAVAAAEVIAHGLARQTQDDAYTEPVGEYVERLGPPSEALVSLGIEAIDKVAAHSALSAAWRETDDDQEWRDSLERLRGALASA